MRILNGILVTNFPKRYNNFDAKKTRIALRAYGGLELATSLIVKKRTVNVPWFLLIMDFVTK